MARVRFNIRPVSSFPYRYSLTAFAGETCRFRGESGEKGTEIVSSISRAVARRMWFGATLHPKLGPE